MKKLEKNLPENTALQSLKQMKKRYSKLSQVMNTMNSRFLTRTHIEELELLYKSVLPEDSPDVQRMVQNEILIGDILDINLGLIYHDIIAINVRAIQEANIRKQYASCKEDIDALLIPFL